MTVRKLTAADRERADELFAIAFEMPMTRERREETADNDGKAARFHSWAAFDDETNDMMSTLSATDFEMTFDGGICKMGGIGGVASLPQYRRRGGIRACFETMLPALYAGGYDFSYLYPFSTNYYRKFGYECCVQEYDLKIDLALLTPPRVGGTLRMADRSQPLTDAIRAVDGVWESRFNMAVRHGEGDYAWTEKQDPAVKQQFTYVYFAPDGTPKAYTVFTKKDEPDGRNLVCDTLCFADKEGFAGLMNLFKSLAADHRTLKCRMPDTVGMQYLMPEWSLGAAVWSVHAAGMVRVVNVKSVLEKAAYRGEGEGAVTLRVADPQIAENDRCFAVRFAGGRAVSVTETDDAPDAALTVAAFSALIAGVCDFTEALAWMDGIDARPHAADTLARVFYRKPMVTTTYF